MNKDQLLNSWSRELALQSTMSDVDAKKFLFAFYDKVIGFHLREITEEDIEEIKVKAVTSTPRDFKEGYSESAVYKILHKAILNLLKKERTNECILPSVQFHGDTCLKCGHKTNEHPIKLKEE